MFDRDLSDEVGVLVEAENKECYLNAFRGMSEIDGECYYVEGFAVPGDFPIIAAHAWLEVDGKIVDPTPAYRNGDHVYFPAILYTRARACEGAIKNGSVLPIIDLEFMRDPLVQAAYSAAHVHAYGFTPEELREKLTKGDE
jgi:hypothetical protein